MSNGRPDVSEREVVFLSARRTAFGAFGGSRRELSATDLAVVSGRAAIEAGGLDASDLDHVIYENALQTSSDAMYLARHVGLRVGALQSTPAVTVNRLCGSGFQAVTQAAQEILLGHAEAILCGGTESMSQAPHVVRGARWGELRIGDVSGRFEDLLWQALLDTNCGLMMAQTVEELATRYEVTREESDAVALRSHRCAIAAWEEGRFADEVVPVEVETRKGQREFAYDEHIRPDVTEEGLARLRPYFREDGLVTAGNRGLATVQPHSCSPQDDGRRIGVSPHWVVSSRGPMSGWTRESWGLVRLRRSGRLWAVPD